MELELTPRKFSVCSGLIGAFHYVRGILFDNNFVLVLVAGFSSEWKLKYLFRKKSSLRVLSFSLHSSFPLSLSVFLLCVLEPTGVILQCCCFLQSTRLHFKSISGKQIRLQSRYINFWPTDFEGSYMLQKFI